MKKSMAFLVLILFTSCRVYHMYDGKSKPVSFLADSTVFDQSNGFGSPALAYADLLGLNGTYVNTFDLSPDINVEAIIARPTLFIGRGVFLVFPGDKLTVSKNSEGVYELKSRTNETRTRELLVLNKFQDIAPVAFPMPFRNLSLDALVAVEEQFKKKSLELTNHARNLFDSLQTVYRTSMQFRDATRDYINNRYTFSLISLYKENKDSLLAKGLYRKKCLELLPALNRLSTVSEIDYSVILVNEFANEILPHNIDKITSTAEFENDFTEIEKNFSGLAREYFLSRVIYSGYKKKLHISSTYLEKYRSLCTTGNYLEIVNRLTFTQSLAEEKTLTRGNHLFTMNRNEITSIENILTQNKGKVIFFDFMASWCVPCREDIPQLQKLKRGYSKKDIVFINLSLDKEYQYWKKYIYTSKLEKENSFMFVSAHESPFINQHTIDLIPRYLIFDKAGVLVERNAPRPKDGKLKTVIDSLVHL